MTDLEVATMCHMYVQPVSQHFNQRTVGEALLQSPRKIRTIPIYKRWEAIVLLRIDTLGCQQKEMGNKGGGKSMIQPR